MDNKPIVSGTFVNNVLNPVSLDDFFTRYWEQQPLHIERTSTNPFAMLVTADDIETILTTHELFYPIVQLSQSGLSISATEYTDANNKIISARMLSRHQSGSTIVMSHAHKLLGSLMKLCRSVQRSLMMRCQTNLYLSPPGKQGFNPHFDTHDVFILQVSGTKTFNFYAGGASFPTSADRFNKDVHTVGEKTEEIKLSAGDTLYIPRGFVHDAVADDSEPSLHITLGVYPVLLHELMGELIQMGIETDATLRRSVSQALWQSTDSAASNETLEALRHSIGTLVNPEGLDLALSRLRDEFALDTTPPNKGVLANSYQKPKPAVDETTIDFSNVLQTQRTHGVLTVRAFGAVLEFSEPYASAIEWLHDHASATVQDVPDLTESQKAALVKKLHDSGLVR